jgi:hypothetical protein
MRKLLFLIVAFSSFGAILARANDIYVAQNATGSHSGASCADARAYTSLAGGDWVAGNTIHLCGTFSMPAGASGTITVSGSGASGSPISIKFETGAGATAPYWGQNGFIYNNGYDYIVVDGGTNGYITATANGTNLANQTTSSSGTGAIYFDTVSNSEIKNMNISNMYVHVCTDPSRVTCTDHNGQLIGGIYWPGGSNVTIDNNTIHDAFACIRYGFGAGTSTNVSIFNNTVSNCNWSIVTATGSGTSSAILNTDLIYGNKIHDWGNWDVDNNGLNHHDGIFVYSTSSSAQITGLQIHDNYIYGSVQVAMTSPIYISQTPGSITGSYVFNNTINITRVSGTVIPYDALIFDWATNTSIYNNTLIGIVNSGLGGSCLLTYGTGLTTENNICDTGYYALSYSSNAGYALSDYNTLFNYQDIASKITYYKILQLYTAWFSSTTYNLNDLVSISGANYQSKANGNLNNTPPNTTWWNIYPAGTNGLAWQGASVTPDAHSTAADPNLNKNSVNPPYQLSSNTSPAYRTGVNLTSVCATVPALCTAADGNARPSSGAWDMGADYLTTPIALVQRVPTTNETACSSTSATCSITVAATGAGHAGVLTYAGHPGVYISSVSTDGSWTVPTGCKASASGGATSCAYNLSLTGGATTETVTLNTASPGTYGYLSFHEVSSTGTFAFDAAGAVTDSTSSLSLAGAGLSLTGSDDFIVQTWRVAGGSASSVTSPYIDLTGFGSFSAYALSINTSSGAAPTLTMTLPTTGVAGAIALSVH